MSRPRPALPAQSCNPAPPVALDAWLPGACAHMRAQRQGCDSNSLYTARQRLLMRARAAVWRLGKSEIRLYIATTKFSSATRKLKSIVKHSRTVPGAGRGSCRAPATEAAARAGSSGAHI
eukprot:scaffold25527_cov173-Isochrysis_galbana.AAC.2